MIPGCAAQRQVTTVHRMTHCGECTVQKQKNNTVDSNVVPHRSTNTARACLTSLSGREAVLSCLYGRSCL